MKKLARKLNKTRRRQGDDGSGDDNFSLPTRNDSLPMDSEEQQEMVRSFEKAQAQQSFLWRSVFAALLFCFAGFLVFSIYQQALFPWGLRYHAYFMDEVDSWIIIAAGLFLFFPIAVLSTQLLFESRTCSHSLIEWAAVLVCSVTIAGMIHNTKFHRPWLWYSCGAGALLAIFWLYLILKLPKFRWDAIWLPFGPMSGAGFCLYVDYLLNESSEEVRKLRGYMYAYKAR